MKKLCQVLTYPVTVYNLTDPAILYDVDNSLSNDYSCVAVTCRLLLSSMTRGIDERDAIPLAARQVHDPDIQ